jgi:hypothetical protein
MCWLPKAWATNIVRDCIICPGCLERLGLTAQRTDKRRMLTVSGTCAVSIMLLVYGQEVRSKWFVLVFAIASAVTATYSGLVEAYPIVGVEAVWSLVALLRFRARLHAESGAESACAKDRTVGHLLD